MITRLEVNGFKNLIGFAVDFAPYTCIAGPNGVGKSNVFDAIRFLSLLADHTLTEAALLVRGSGVEAGEVGDLFWSDGQNRSDKFTITAEMSINPSVRDDFGRPAEANSTYLRYEIRIGYEAPSARGSLSRLVLLSESLNYIKEGEATGKLRFPLNPGKFRKSVVSNKRRTRSGYKDRCWTDGDSGSSGWWVARTRPDCTSRDRSKDDCRNIEYIGHAHHTCRAARDATVALSRFGTYCDAQSRSVPYGSPHNSKRWARCGDAESTRKRGRGIGRRSRDSFRRDRAAPSRTGANRRHRCRGRRSSQTSHCRGRREHWCPPAGCVAIGWNAAFPYPFCTGGRSGGGGVTLHCFSTRLPFDAWLGARVVGTARTTAGWSRGANFAAEGEVAVGAGTRS